MTNILFICHGNICRSPMAEFVMKELVRRAGLAAAFSIDSKAARTDELGNDTHPGSTRKLQEQGIPFQRRQARLVGRGDYQRYDFLICMDRENYNDMLRLFGGDPEHKISLLLSFAGETREVADPWYTGDFNQTYEDIVKGCRGLLRTLGAKGSAN